MCKIRGMSLWVVEDISALRRRVVFIDLFTYLPISLSKSFSVKGNSSYYMSKEEI